jgi:cation diffusion facilitator family transporter
MQDGNRRAILAAFAANFGIAIAKFIGFAATGAASMLAEAVHSLADTGNQGLLLMGAKRASRTATREHPFGYGRERYFWAFVVALVLFSLGSLFAITEGIDKVRHPHELASPQWAIGILIAALALEGWSLYTAIVEANKVRGETGWWEFIRKTKSPELPVVLLEDLGALVGLCIALVGVSTSIVTGDSRFDAMGSIAIGVLLAVIAAVIAVEMQSLLIGEGASRSQARDIEHAIETFPAVKSLIHIRTLHLGPDELLVAAKVELDASLDFPGIAVAIDAIEASIRDQVPIARVIYIEPDVARTPTVDV